MLVCLDHIDRIGSLMHGAFVLKHNISINTMLSIIMSKSNPCRESKRTLNDVTLRIVFSIPESRSGLNGWRRILNPGRAAVFAALAVTVGVVSPLHYEMGGEAIYIHA